MRKTARKSGSSYDEYWLLSPDKSMPFRWMGCVVAVYDYSACEKAKRGVERSRIRRGTKKRGKESTLKRKLMRARLGAARFVYLESPTRKIEGAMKSLSRIDNLAKRSDRHCFKLSLRRAGLERELKNVRGKLMSVNDQSTLEGSHPLSNSGWSGLLKARDRLRRSLSTLRSRELHAWSSRWGLPLEVTGRRISQLAKHPGLRALPRVTLRDWAGLDGELGGAARRLLQVATDPVRLRGALPFESLPCRCRDCRTMITCPNRHGIGAGFRTCAYCGFQRHESLPFRRDGSNRRGDRKGPRGRGRGRGRGAPPRLT
jgi:hypothetical protein